MNRDLRLFPKTSLAPAWATAAMGEVATLTSHGETRRAAEILLRFPDPGDDADLHQALSSAWYALKRYDLSLMHARAASQLGASGIASHYLLATLEMFAGQLERAEALFEDCIQQAPNLAGAHWSISKLRRQSEASNHIDRLTSLAKRMSQNDPDLAYVHYALFKELDDLGDYDLAWKHLVFGCLVCRRNTSYDVRVDVAAHEQLSRTYSTAPTSAEVPCSHGPRPIFIVGLPRSGTTLLETMLAKQPQVTAGGELDELPFALARQTNHIASSMPDAVAARMLQAADHRLIGDDYRTNIRWRAGQNSIFTDKCLNNYRAIGTIQRALPEARIIHVRKAPLEACFSLLKEYFGGRYPYSYQLAELATYQRSQARLIDHWRQSGHDFLDLEYADIVSKPEAVAEAVFSYCKIEKAPSGNLHEATDMVVATASTAQVREPISRRYLAASDRYAAHLAPLRDMLEAS